MSEANSPRNIKISTYTYDLPDERIAKYPLKQRDLSKLLVYRGGEIRSSVFRDLPEELPEGSFLVFNNTRVVQARLLFRKATGAAIEIFCLDPHSPADYQLNFSAAESCEWKCMVGNAKKWKEGPLEASAVIEGREVRLSARMLGREGDSYIIGFKWTGGAAFSQVLQGFGHLPIPPYLNRPAEEADKTTYQTVYSKIEGSVAAPTAGLHFTPELLASLRERGINSAELTLHVGAGTFRPVSSELIGGHPMHSEHIFVRRGTIETLMRNLGHIVAVGTTSVRTLESLYHIGCKLAAGLPPEALGQWECYEGIYEHVSAEESLSAILAHLDRTGTDALVGETRIIIAPGYDFRLVNAMITNFHQPRSTLLLLIAAFVGDDWKKIYKFALDGGYRFLSYGDSSLLFRK